MIFLKYLTISNSINVTRDAPPEFSTVPFDLEAEILPEGAPAPIDDTGK